MAHSVAASDTASIPLALADFENPSLQVLLQDQGLQERIGLCEAGWQPSWELPVQSGSERASGIPRRAEPSVQGCPSVLGRMFTS